MTSELLRTACMLAALMREEPNEGHALLLIAHVRDNVAVFAAAFAVAPEELLAFVTTGPGGTLETPAAQVVVDDLLRRLGIMVATNK
jgi:hypothetical protein